MSRGIEVPSEVKLCWLSGPSLHLGDPPPSSIDQHDYHGFVQLSTKPTGRHISNINLHFSQIHLR